MRNMPVVQKLKSSAVMLMAVFLLSGLAAPAQKLHELPYYPEELGKEANQHYLLDFFSPFCGTCVRMEPAMHRLKQLYKKDIRFVRLDLTNTAHEKYFDMFNIEGTPNYILFDAFGKPVFQMRETISSVVLEVMLRKHLGKLESHDLTSHPALAAAKKNGKHALVAFQPDDCPKASCDKALAQLDAMRYALRDDVVLVALDADKPAVARLMEDIGIKRDRAYALFDPAGHALYSQQGGFVKDSMWNYIRMFLSE